MKKIIIVLIFLQVQSLYSQEKSDDLSFHRLLIFNAKNEMMVVKIQNTNFWVTPGIYGNSVQSIKNGLDSLSASYGVRIEAPNLKGVFLLKRDFDGKKSTSLRNIYTATIRDEALKMPEGIEEIKWLSTEKALQLITFPHIKLMVQQILNNPEQIWSGGLTQFKENEAWMSKIVQNFYPLSENSIVVIDGLKSFRETNMKVRAAHSRQVLLPILKGKEINKVISVRIIVEGNLKPIELKSLTFTLDKVSSVEKIQVFAGKNATTIDQTKLFGDLNQPSSSFKIVGSHKLQPGENYFFLSMSLNNNADLSQKILVECKNVLFSNSIKMVPEAAPSSRAQRIGIALRQKNQDGVHTYRIPGLATTNTGTLIAVYDNRYHGGVDLQADVDVGLSRSTDGGNTWEPMKVIMDMGEYGGKGQDENGIGDPAVLIDRTNNTIWVAAVWAHGHPGKRNWWASQPGMAPEKTSQFVLVKSIDDGRTWSDPINITSQIKNPEWYLLLQGPGKGISLRDGTLVFPAQFKDKNQMPHSTIIYSKDHGKSWNIGTGAKSNTTEAQVVELEDGRLMLNMRDNRGGSRSIYTTSDLGKTWKVHESSRKALKEPVCMASLIGFEHPEKGQMLFFSNPNNIKSRSNITIKTSFDQGHSWPEENQLELYENHCSGYSCMTLIDNEYIGILYEGYSELYFEKISIDELIEMD